MKQKASPSLRPKSTACDPPKSSWWYEDLRGIDVVVVGHDGVKTKTVRITWGALLKAAKRCGKLS